MPAAPEPAPDNGSTVPRDQGRRNNTPQPSTGEVHRREEDVANAEGANNPGVSSSQTQAAANNSASVQDNHHPQQPAVGHEPEEGTA